MAVNLTLPVEAWNAINTLGLLGIGLLAYFNNRRAKADIREVKEIVDGPLSKALNENAMLARRIASLTPHDPAAEGIARDAEAVQANRNKPVP